MSLRDRPRCERRGWVGRGREGTVPDGERYLVVDPAGDSAGYRLKQLLPGAYFNILPRRSWLQLVALDSSLASGSSSQFISLRGLANKRSEIFVRRNI